MTDSALTHRSPLSDAEIERLLETPPVWRQSELLRALGIALLSTIVLFGGLGWLVAQSEGWESVRKSFFSWPDFKDAWPMIWDGFKLNVRIFMIAEPIVLAFGLLLAMIRVSRSPALFPIRALAVVYIDFFRGAPPCS